MVRHRWELRTRATVPGAPRGRVRLGAGRAATLCVLFAALAWISASLLFHPPARAGEELGRIELERTDQAHTRPGETQPGQTPPGHAQPGHAQPSGGAAASATGGPAPDGVAPQDGAQGQGANNGQQGSGGQDAGGGAPAAATAADVVVHVAGAVKRPGVYEFPAGTRAHEAVDAAGGLTREANAGAVNLASPLADGQQLYIPKQGEPAPAAGSGPGGGAGTAPEGGGAATGAVNVNTATSGELQRLPGIGPALAERIVEFRQRNGPFGSLAELDAVSGIGPGVLAQLEGMVSFG